MGAAAIIPSLIPMFVVIAMRRAELRIHRQLAEARAFTAETAVPCSPSRGFEKRRLQGLIHGGAVRQTADHRCFIDADGWSEYYRRRRRRVLLALSVVVVLVGVVLAVSFGMR